MAGDSPRLWIPNWPHWGPIKDSHYIIAHLFEKHSFLIESCLLGTLSINFFLDDSLVCFPVAVIKQWPKSTWERKDTISSYSLQSTIKGSQGRNLETEIEVETIGNVAYQLVPSGLFSSPSIQFKSTCLWMVTPTVGWHFLYQLAIFKMPCKHAHKHIWLSQCPNWGYLFVGDTSLCQFSTQYLKENAVALFILFCVYCNLTVLR